MGPIASLVDGTTNKLIPHQQMLPLPLSVLYRVFNRIHRLWHWYRKGTLYANPNNLFQLMAGHSLNIIAGDSRLLRVMAQCVMISTRILEWIKEYNKLIRCWNKWVNELLHYPPVYIREKWNKENSCLSPSIAYYWRVKYRTISHRIQRSMHLTGRICRRMFALSMKSIDAIDSFSMTPDEQRSSINELFFNTSKWIETLANNKETLIIGMKKNQKTIEHLLKGLGNYYTFEQFLTAVEKTGNKVKTAHDTIKGINGATGRFFIHLGKEALFGIANLMNLSKHMPSWLVPELYPEQKKHMEEINKRPRFPPKGSLMRPSYYKKYIEKQNSQEDLNAQNKIIEEEVLKIYNRIHQSSFSGLNRSNELSLPSKKLRGIRSCYIA